MLKRRLIASVIVRQGWAVQSFGYGRYLPLGRVEVLVENLDRWGADEIMIQVIDRSIAGLGPDFDLLDRLGRMGLGTPLIYGGGIRNADDGVAVTNRGADRIVVDALLRDDPEQVRAFARQAGAQAVIAALPVLRHKGQTMAYDYRLRAPTTVPQALMGLVAGGYVCEVMVIDSAHEGQACGFDANLIDDADLSRLPLILFGGISDPEQMRALFRRDNVAALAIGNFLNYRECAIQNYKALLGDVDLRPAVFRATG